MSNQSIDVSRLWEAYKKGRDLVARDGLIIEYSPLVKYVAGRVAIGLPANVEFDDLVSFGIFGLLDAVEKYEPERGIKFETYALARVRGAMIDGLRSLDWAPRSVRKKARELERTMQVVDSQLGRPATDAEIAKAMGVTLNEYHKSLQEVACATLTSLDEVWADDNKEFDRLSLVDAVRDESSPDPVEIAEYSDLRDRLAVAIDQLSERERTVIALYYFEGLTLKEIGAVLEVTEARISQIHTKAITRLRSKLLISE